jgi:hypothetical protein
MLLNIEITVILLISTFTISTEFRYLRSFRDRDANADFGVDIPSLWESCWTNNTLNFKQINTGLIGEGAISRINASNTDNLASLLVQVVSEQTTPNRGNFEEFKVDSNYKVLRNIDEYDMLGIKVVGYDAIIQIKDKCYRLSAYYEPGIRDVMGLGIDKIIRSFKLKDN